MQSPPAEVRKLQKIKGGSYMLSLPRNWVETHQLKSGDQIAVARHEGGSLMLYPAQSTRRRSREVRLSFQDYPDRQSLEYTVGTYYMQGADRIIIQSKQMVSAELKRQLKRLLMELTGFEVAEEDSNRIIFHVLLDPSRYSLGYLINRNSSFALQLHADAVESLVKWRPKLAEEVVERSQEATRYYRITIRQLSLASQDTAVAQAVGIADCRECITFALVARDLHRLIYHSTSIARNVLLLPGDLKLPSEIASLINQMSEIARKMQVEAVSAFLEKDTRKALQVLKDMQKIRSLEKDAQERILERIHNKDVAVILSMIARETRRIAGYSIAITDDAMNRVLAPSLSEESEMSSLDSAE